MNTQETIELFNKYVIANYGRLPRVIVKGEGCYMWDADGNRYLDLFPGWAVSCSATATRRWSRPSASRRPS